MTLRRLVALAVVAGVVVGAGPGAADADVQRLYVLDCGQNVGKDQSRWSPGVNEGKALVAQLEQLGVKPADVTHVAVSHTHGDHVGNIALFPASTVWIQGAEYDWAMAGPSKPAFASTQTIKKLAGDHDVFSDGSVTIVSTPGHTPGHQSLLVKLPKTGWLLLSGDAVHFQDNWTHKRVPSMNFNRDQTLASLQRIATLLEERKAQLWINHDKAQSERLRYAPAYYD